MLDKTIPWYSFIMSLEPTGFKEREMNCPGVRVRPYESEKDEIAWAKIETAVGEFDTVEEAAECHRHYLEYEDELRRRQWFVVDENDEAVATCTVWWSGEDRIPCIHALSCLPEKQGCGYGRLAAQQAIRSALEAEQRTIWLETQTWSWKAICLYLSLGFVPRRTAVFNDTPNDYVLSCPLIGEKAGEKVLDRILETAID